MSLIGNAVDEVNCSGPLGHCEEDCMSDALSFTEIDGQHVELLPGRIVMSMFMMGGREGNAGNGGNGGTGGNGGSARGGIGLNVLNITLTGDQTNSAADAHGGTGGSANGGVGGAYKPVTK
jgi:hypothetical protein